MNIAPASLTNGSLAALMGKTGAGRGKNAATGAASKNDLLGEGNPELVKDINKHSIYKESMLSNRLVVGSMKNLEELKANVKMQAANATLPEAPYKKTMKEDILKQASRQLDAAVTYARNAEQKNEEVAGSLMDAESFSVDI